MSTLWMSTTFSFKMDRVQQRSTTGNYYRSSSVIYKLLQEARGKATSERGREAGKQNEDQAGGLNQTGKKMTTWLGSGIIHLVNGMEMPTIKVPRPVKTTNFTPFQLSTLNSAIRIKHSSSNLLSSMSRSLILVVDT